MSRAGELLDADNILTSPDLLRGVGLSSRKQDIITLTQTRKEVQNDKIITVRDIVNIDYKNSILFINENRKQKKKGRNSEDNKPHIPMGEDYYTDSNCDWMGRWSGCVATDCHSTADSCRRLR